MRAGSARFSSGRFIKREDSGDESEIGNGKTGQVFMNPCPERMMYYSIGR